ncbi:unnamed protein product [Pleuronectes platessa]|uniref:Uncharacterized protein n=1 Tax=Pleuronectes platessa TaxID=8262 RepID=A0A9N7VXP7_PLEPL|nr:unnamed protein product [Pleuronectes platessa]
MKPGHSPHLTCMCACMPSGQWAWAWASQVSLESSANHNVPFPPLCCHSAAFSFFFFTHSPSPFTLQPFLQTDQQDVRRRKVDQDFSKMERKHEEGGGGLSPDGDL